jgi:DNA anti-recombination protein RmuC
MAPETDSSLDDLVRGLQRARGGSAQTQRQIQREDELRRCMQKIAVQRASQVSTCHAFQAHVTAEIDRLQGLHVQRRVAALEEMYDTAAQQLLAAFVETTGGGA